MELEQTLEQFKEIFELQRGITFVERLQGTPQTLKSYNVATHAQQCAIIYSILCDVTKRQVDIGILLTLLLHDNIESVTGDLLAPAKCDELWDKIENRIMNTNVITPKDNAYTVSLKRHYFPTEEQMHSELNEDDYILVKIIDMTEFFLRAIEEWNCGNHCLRLKCAILNAKSVLLKRIQKLNRVTPVYDDMTEIIVAYVQRNLSMTSLLYA